MVILRLGMINIASSRYLDVIEDNAIEKLILALIDNQTNRKNISNLIKTADFFGLSSLLRKKLSIIWLPKFRPFRKYTGLFKTTKPWLVMTLYKYYNNEFIRNMKNILGDYNYDVLWFGDNDFEFPDILFLIYEYLEKCNSNILLSYKETRFKKRWTEKNLLKKASSIIFPLSDYLTFFKRLYNLDLKHKTLFADIDWRYSRIVHYVRSEIPDRKLSEKDKIPHVCILTGKAFSEPTEKRSGPRYYYVPIINELTRRGIMVHLHALKIFPSRSGKNIYKEIEDKNRLFRIENPLKLEVYEKEQGYNVLKRYDAGILHVSVPKFREDLFEFQKLNIPNRLFEYELSGVVPIVPHGSLPAVEKISKEKNYGIIFRDYDELADRLFELIKNKNWYSNTINTFRDFTDVILKASNTKQ